MMTAKERRNTSWCSQVRHSRTTRLQHHQLLAPNWHQTERAADHPQTLTVTTRWSLLVVEPPATTVTTADLNTAMRVNRRAPKTLTRAERTATTRLTRPRRLTKLARRVRRTRR
jgi:hypothetical protein